MTANLLNSRHRRQHNKKSKLKIQTLESRVVPTIQAVFTTAAVTEGSVGQAVFTNPSGGVAPYTYSFDFDNDGTFEIAKSSTANATVPASYLPDGPSTQTVHGRVNDSKGAFADFTSSITITNVPPTVQISNPVSAAPGAAINFMAAISDPSPADAGSGFSYSWDFGDGVTSTHPTPSHSFSTSGSHTVNLTVKDKDNGTTTTATTFMVAPPPRLLSLQVGSGSQQRSVVNSLTLAFDSPITFVGDPAGAFSLIRPGQTGSVTLSAKVVTTTSTTVTLTFGGSMTQFGSLIDGNYQLTIAANKIATFGGLDGDADGVAGDNFTAQLQRLFGDANGDHSVNNDDFNTFRAA